MSVKEERQAWSECIDIETGEAGRFDVGETICDGEGEFLGRRGPGFTDVVAGHRDRVPLRHLGGAVTNHVGDDPHARTWREDELLLGLVLLEDVVLDGSAESRLRRSVLLGVGDEHRQDRRRRRVDRHRYGRNPEVDPVEEILHVGQGVDGDTALAHLPDRHRVVGVLPHEGRQVERRGQSVASRSKDLLEATIRVLRRAESGEHPHRPELGAVPRRIDPAGVGILPGEQRVIGAIDRLEGDSGHRDGVYSGANA